MEDEKEEAHRFLTKKSFSQNTIYSINILCCATCYVLCYVMLCYVMLYYIHYWIYCCVCTERLCS